jgi:hypothetical protein
LPQRKRVALYLHRLICIGCDRYHEQLHFTHDTIHGLEVHLDGPFNDSLSADVKGQLKQTLHNGGD